MNSVGKLLRDPALVEIAHKGETADTVEQFIVRVPQTLKPDLLRAVLAENAARSASSCSHAPAAAPTPPAGRLKRAGFAAEAIHSDRSQNQRRRALDNFASGATDVHRGHRRAGPRHRRGRAWTTWSTTTCPPQPEDYVHRIGRTGRAGASGYGPSRS